MSRCSAHANRTGVTCTRWAVRGAQVCPSHGGRAPQVKAAARRRLATQAAIRDLSELGYQPVTDPAAELADLAGRAVALERWAESAVAQLGDDLTSTDRIGAEEVRATLRLLERSLDRAGKLVQACAKLGLSERQIQLDESKARLVITLLTSAMRSVGVPPSMQAQLWAAVKIAIAHEQSSAPATLSPPSRRKRPAIEGP